MSFQRKSGKMKRKVPKLWGIVKCPATFFFIFGFLPIIFTQSFRRKMPHFLAKMGTISFVVSAEKLSKLLAKYHLLSAMVPLRSNSGVCNLDVAAVALLLWSYMQSNKQLLDHTILLVPTWLEVRRSLLQPGLFCLRSSSLSTYLNGIKCLIRSWSLALGVEWINKSAIFVVKTRGSARDCLQPSSQTTCIHVRHVK